MDVASRMKYETSQRKCDWSTKPAVECVARVCRMSSCRLRSRTSDAKQLCKNLSEKSFNKSARSSSEGTDELSPMVAFLLP